MSDMDDLKDLKKGDQVMGYVAGRVAGRYVLGTVERTTKTLFFVEGCDVKYRLKDGEAVGRRDVWARSSFRWRRYDEVKYKDWKQRELLAKARRLLRSRLLDVTENKALENLSDDEVNKLSNFLDSLKLE